MVRVAVSDRVDGYDEAWQPVMVCTFADAMEIVEKMHWNYSDFELLPNACIGDPDWNSDLERFTFYRSESTGFELRLEVRE